jgi:hypothetical protein
MLRIREQRLVRYLHQHLRRPRPKRQYGLVGGLSGELAPIRRAGAPVQTLRPAASGYRAAVLLGNMSMISNAMSMVAFPSAVA